MTEKLKVYKLSVSDICKLYFFDTLQISNEVCKRGVKEHEKNGYNNKKLFERYYQIELDTILQIRGIPDAIEPPYVIEFKTCSRKTLETVVDYAEIQLHLYMWLTGLEKGRVDVYFKDTKQLVKGYRYVDYNESLAKNIIMKAYRKLKKTDFY